MKKKITLTLISIVVSFFTIKAQTTVNLNPIKDNTILSENTSNASGGGRNFIGRTNNSALRRALLQFDLSVIPSGVTITEVSLDLNVDRGDSPSSNVNLHRLTADWGEGTSTGSGGGGGGGAAIAPDATWINTITGSPSTLWSSQGGDFESVATANTTYTGATGTLTFETSAALVNEIQNWLDGTNSNFGWILIGDESTNSSTIRIGSKELGVAPVLNITYDPVLSVNDNLFEGDEIVMFPNPTNGELYFDFLKGKNLTAYIYNNAGGLVSTKKGISGENFSLDINQPSGVYIVDVVDSSGAKKSFKVIKK